MMALLHDVLVRYHRIIKFAVTGGLSAVVNLVILYALTEWCGVHYLISSVVGYCCSFFVNFFLQKVWAFRDREKRGVGIKMGLFFGNSMLNIALNTLAMHVLVSVFHIWYLAAQCLVIFALAVMNYTLYRLYIFRADTQETCDAEHA